jgi:hypothetical protein
VDDSSLGMSPHGAGNHNHVATAHDSHTSMPGGWSELIFQPFDKEFLETLVSVVPEINDQLFAAGSALKSFAEPVALSAGDDKLVPNYIAPTLISYQQQVVDGLNYNVNLLVIRFVDGEVSAIPCAVKIYQPLPYTGKPAEVTDVSAAPFIVGGHHGGAHSNPMFGGNLLLENQGRASLGSRVRENRIIAAIQLDLIDFFAYSPSFSSLIFLLLTNF